MIPDRIARSLASVLELASVAFLVLVLIVVCLQVFFRYVVNLAVPWTEEAARYLCVWMIFVGCAATAAYEGHLRVTWLLDKLTGRAHALATIAICAVMILFDAIVLLGAIRLTELNWHQEATTFPMPVGILYVALAVFAVFSILFLLKQLADQLRRAIGGRD